MKLVFFCLLFVVAGLIFFAVYAGLLCFQMMPEMRNLLLESKLEKVHFLDLIDAFRRFSRAYCFFSVASALLLGVSIFKLRSQNKDARYTVEKC